MPASPHRYGPRARAAVLPLPEHDPTGLGAYGSPTTGPFRIGPSVRDTAELLWARPGVLFPLHRTTWHYARIDRSDDGLESWCKVTTHNPREATADGEANAIYAARGSAR